MLDAQQLEALQPHAEAASQLLKTLANAHRLQILCCLGESEMAVGELNALIPLSQSALSQHLAKLRQDRLVQTRRDAQTIYYRVSEGPALAVIQVLQQHFCAPHASRRRPD